MSRASVAAGVRSVRSDAPTRIKGRSVERRVSIEAPPELVWDFVADFAGWSSRNPLYPRSAGSAEEGQTVRFSVKLDGMKPRRDKAA